MACIKAFLHSGFTLMLWIYLLCPSVSCATFLEAGPNNMTVVEGDKVSLICDVNNDNDNTIFWTYLIGPGRRRYISSDEYIYPSSGYDVDPENYKVIIDQSQQTYKLVILTINWSTEAGIYDCGYDPGSGIGYTPLASAMITVIIESYPNNSISYLGIALIVTIAVLIIFAIIIFAITIPFLCNKWKIKRKMNRKVKRVRTNLSEESPSNIPRVIQMRDPNRGEHSGTEAERSGELSLAISCDSHQYSSKIYRSDSRSFSTVLESEWDLEPDNDRQIRQGLCHMKTDLMEVNQKATHLEVQRFEPFYETMRDKVFTLTACEEKPKTSVHKRLMTSSSMPDEKQQEFKDTVVEQKTSNSSSSVAHWIVDPVDLHSRPLPRCPKNPITVPTLYDHLPSAGDIGKNEFQSYEEINKVTSLPQIVSQGFGKENKSEGGTGTSSETKGTAVQASIVENVLNDDAPDNIDCSGVIGKSLRSSRKDTRVNSEQCNEIYLEMKAKSDDPSHLDNRYLQD